jgi:hypothetical protein
MAKGHATVATEDAHRQGVGGHGAQPTRTYEDGHTVDEPPFHFPRIGHLAFGFSSFRGSFCARAQGPACARHGRIE